MKKRLSVSLLAFSLLLFIVHDSNAQIKPNSSTAPPAASSTLPVVTHSATGKVNYVRTFDFLRSLKLEDEGSGAGQWQLSTEIGANNVMQATQYFDGLGRPIQAVARKASGTGKDLVTFMTYDAYGRQVYAPMPYVAMGSTNGALQLTPSASQESYLGGFYTGEDIFYSKTSYEASPLNRVLKQVGPGNSWTAANSGAGAGVSMQYLTNTAAEGVRFWTVGTTNPTSIPYQAAELTKLVTTDENGHQVKEFTNSRGQVVLKQVQKDSIVGASHANWLSTYYLYDDYGNLRHVLPPRAVELISDNWIWNSTEMKDLVFSYTYDGRNRMITKKVPGAGEVHMVYDKLDRLVLSQDANQRVSAENQWTFTKYDPLGRPVLTGFITSSSDRAAMQTTADNWTGVMHVAREGLNGADVVEGATVTVSNRDTSIDTYRTKTTGYIDFLPGMVSEDGAVFESEMTLALSYEYTFYEGYHDATFPKLADYTNLYQVNTINYYDDYEFTSKTWSSDYNGFYSANQGTTNAVVPVQDTRVKGMATGSKVRVLDTNDYLTTVMFYDDRGRVIQTQGENHLGGTDISTTQYDFAGRVLHTYTKHSNPQSSANSTTRILKEFAYDHTGRLLNIKEKLNGASTYKTLVTHTYNELGELESKVLGSGLETLDYDYNVRGWLKSINGDELETADHGTSMSGHYFAMELSYDYGFSENQYNGNISGVKWKSKSSDQIRAYGFDYDAVNRLTKADYSQSSNWANTTNDFSTGYGYDANGNILKLWRKGTVAGAIKTLDSLQYDYGSGFTNASASNRLVAVKDIQTDFGQGDFKDGNSSGNDYQYDLNGNMEYDKNKGITDITYNHLNLPVTVSFGSNKTITYTYDAAGIKLRKMVNDNWDITVTDYAGGFIYENNELQHFGHEEGRVRKNKDSQLVYDYFVKDHLGNTRMTLTESLESTPYEATMEPADSTAEQSLFLNIAETRSSAESFQGSSSAEVGPESIGPAKMLVVNAGDKVDLTVYAKYGLNSTESGNTTSIGATLASLFGSVASGASVYEQGVYNGLNDNRNSFLASALNGGTSTVPHAYLNYVFFDKDFNHVASKSDFVQVTSSSSGAFAQLSVNDITIEESGYLYVYLSNEGRVSDGGNVYFDEFKITHTNGHILQEDHYYPFGMSINALSSTAPLSTPNKFKYNGQEEQTEFDINIYDYGARNYDAQLGRFFNIDRFSEKYMSSTPYHYTLNNPINFIDINGDSVQAVGTAGEVIYLLVNQAKACGCKLNISASSYENEDGNTRYKANITSIESTDSDYAEQQDHLQALIESESVITHKLVNTNPRLVDKVEQYGGAYFSGSKDGGGTIFYADHWYRGGWLENGGKVPQYQYNVDQPGKGDGVGFFTYKRILRKSTEENIYAAKKTRVIPFHEAIAHEMAHAYEWEIDNLKKLRYVNRRDSENNAIIRTNMMRKKKGIPLRPRQ